MTIYARRGRPGSMDEDHVDIEINDEQDVDLETHAQESVGYSRYSLDSYVTFTDDSGEDVTYSITDIDDLITALEYIKDHHKRLEEAR